MTRLDSPLPSPGHGDGVTQAARAIADMDILRPITHHVDRRVQCFWCLGKVFGFGSTPDAARHYCRSCVSAIMALSRPQPIRCTSVHAGRSCDLNEGHPGRHRCYDRPGRGWA